MVGACHCVLRPARVDVTDAGLKRPAKTYKGKQIE